MGSRPALRAYATARTALRTVRAERVDDRIDHPSLHTTRRLVRTPGRGVVSRRSGGHGGGARPRSRRTALWPRRGGCRDSLIVRAPSPAGSSPSGRRRENAKTPPDEAPVACRHRHRHRPGGDLRSITRAVRGTIARCWPAHPARESIGGPSPTASPYRPVRTGPAVCVPPSILGRHSPIERQTTARRAASVTGRADSATTRAASVTTRSPARRVCRCLGGAGPRSVSPLPRLVHVGARRPPARTPGIGDPADVTALGGLAPGAIGGGRRVMPLRI